MRWLKKIVIVTEFMLVLSIVHPGFSSPWEHDSRVWLITTPRSGNHWLSYCLTYLSGHRVTGRNEKVSRTEADFDPTLPYIYQGHIGPKDPFPNDKLILLTRNYLDSLLRNFNGFNHTLNVLNKVSRAKDTITSFSYPLFHNREFIAENNEKGIKLWNFIYEQLAVFDQWTPANRLFICYEELILHPKKTLVKIMKFLDEYGWPIDEYVENIEFHKQTVREFYLSRPYGHCRSNGSEIFPYSKQLSPKQTEQIIAFMRKIDADLFEKYLDKYPYLIFKHRPCITRSRPISFRKNAPEFDGRVAQIFASGASDHCQTTECE